MRCMQRALRLASCACVLALAACAHITRAPTPVASAPPTPAVVSHYDVVPGREAEVVARLRATPPPAQPEMGDGKTHDGDERLLRAQGYVQMGTGYFPAHDAGDAREQALEQGRRVGAEKALIYLPGDDTANAADADMLIAIYYVRLRLPFGANFRDMTSDEQHTLGTDGVEIGEVIGGTPAAAANLRSGDYVFKLDSKPVHDKATFQALLQAHLGRRVTLTIHRNGTTLDRLVRMGTLPTEPGH